MRNLLGTFLVLLLQCAAAQADDTAPAADCALKLYASLSMHPDRLGRIIVPVTVNGETEMLLLDTGTPFSALTAQRVAALKLPVKPHVLRMRLGGLVPMTDVATASSVQFGQAAIGTDFGFGVIPIQTDPFSDGLLGFDIIKNFDVEMDFASNTLKLFMPDHCPGKVVYWTQQPYAAIPFHVNPMSELTIPVTLDGQSMTAMIDTGAPPAVVMNLNVARARFGWREDPPDLKVLNEPLGYYGYRFKLLSLGGASVHDPSARLEKHLDSSGPDLIVGLQALEAFHVFISFKEQVIYLTAKDAH